MQGEDPGLRQNAQWALENITGKKLGPDPARWKLWLDTRDKLAERKEKRKLEIAESLRRAAAEKNKPVEQTDSGTMRLSLSLAGLMLLLVMAASVWFIMPSWLGSKMSAQERARTSGKGSSVSDLARGFRASDHMPDFVVYPFLLSHLTHGNSTQKEIALQLMELRAYGGCRVVTNRKASARLSEPTKTAREWVGKLPRNLLEDVAVLRGPGKRLIRVLDPNNPRWRRRPTKEEERKSRRSYKSWLATKS
jgi:hypothetical protein